MKGRSQNNYAFELEKLRKWHTMCSMLPRDLGMRGAIILGYLATRGYIAVDVRRSDVNKDEKVVHGCCRSRRRSVC